MTEEIAKAIWLKERKRQPSKINRFPSGSCNFVFLIEDEGQRYTLRITPKENIEVLSGSLYWINHFRDTNLPIPKILRSDLDHDPPYAITNYIEGEELGKVYTSLSEKQKSNIAKSVAKAQRTISELGLGIGFGHLNSYHDPKAKTTWEAVVIGHLERSRSWLLQTKAFEATYVDRVLKLLSNYSQYFAKVKPTPFFDDATTKNVIVRNGNFAGIIDLDWICFGDRLYTIALTRMSLLFSLSSLSYIDYLAIEEGITAEQERVLDFYTLVFCVDFMGGLCMQFNKDNSPVASVEEVNLLKTIFEDLYTCM